MRKGIVALIIIGLLDWLCICCLADDPVSVTLTNISLKVIPERYSQSIPAVFEAGATYSQGDLVMGGSNLTVNSRGRVTAGSVYMAETGGTAGPTTPVHVHGSASDGTNTWRSISTGVELRPLERTSVDIVLLSSGATVSISEDRPAQINKGISLITQGASYHYEGQGALHAISSMATGTVISIQETVR